MHIECLLMGIIAFSLIAFTMMFFHRTKKIRQPTPDTDPNQQRPPSKAK